jgi:hypothetical protein
MLFDPQLVQNIYDNPTKALAGVELTTKEREQLLATDRRAWNYDPLRRLRTLRTLTEEFKVSATLALAEKREWAFLDSFFSSKIFHQAMQQRGSLGLAFADFLRQSQQRGTLKTTCLADVLRLETMLARCRRQLAADQQLNYPGNNSSNHADAMTPPTNISDKSRVRLAVGCDVGAFQANVVATMQAVEKYLFEISLMPAMVLCQDAPQLSNLPPVVENPRTYLLCSPATGGVALVNVAIGDYLVLMEARQPISLLQLAQRITTNNLSRAKVYEIAAEALEQGWLKVVTTA